MKKIGITGTIASGKTTVSILLRRKGFRVFDCDGYSRILYQKTNPCFQKITDTFGPSILDEFGEIDRRKLAAVGFSDEEKRPVPMSREDNNYRLAPNYESGGAGLICDVADYIAFADALACGGEGKGGARILSPEMIQLWSANQLGPVSRAAFDEWHRLGYSYALGVRTRVSTAIGGRGQVGEFGWDGAAGAWTMIDPINRLSAFFAMHVRNFGYCYDVIHPTLRDMIYGAVMG